jgi:hypothetical protein
MKIANDRGAALLGRVRPLSAAHQLLQLLQLQPLLLALSSTELQEFGGFALLLLRLPLVSSVLPLARTAARSKMS